MSNRKKVYVFDANGKPKGSIPSVTEAATQAGLSVKTMSYQIYNVRKVNGCYYSFREDFRI